MPCELICHEHFQRCHRGPMQRRMRLGLMQACAGASKLYPAQTQDRAPADPRTGFVKGHKTPGLSRGDRTVGGPTRALWLVWVVQLLGGKLLCLVHWVGVTRLFLTSLPEGLCPHHQSHVGLHVLPSPGSWDPVLCPGVTVSQRCVQDRVWQSGI